MTLKRARATRDQRDDKYRVRAENFFEAFGSLVKSAAQCIQTNKQTKWLAHKVNKSEPRALTKSKQICSQCAQNERLRWKFFRKKSFFPDF